MNVEEFHKRLKELYLPPENQFTLIDVPEIRCAVIDGRGNPDNNFVDAASGIMQSIFSPVARTLQLWRQGRFGVAPVG